MMGLRGTLAGGVCVVAMSLLLARAHPFGDAGMERGAAGKAHLMEHSSVPGGVRATLIAKCSDCHSMETQPRIYGRFAPASWLMERDIVEGRKAMNLSRWDSYSADQQQTLVAKMEQETKTRRMPLLPYRMIHWDAKLTEPEVAEFGEWARGLQGAGGGTAAAGTGDAARGKEAFERRCIGCHTMTESREGPRLQGVYGRGAAGVAGFPYSAALKKAGVVWKDETLERWLADPEEMVPGTDMDFRVGKAQERRDLVAFLRGGGR